jgi:hypothetical protein
MARRVSFDDAATWYVPDIDDNREDDDPFRVLLQPMSGAELAAYERSLVPARSRARGKTDDGSVVARIDLLTEAIFRARVVEVLGYSVTIEKTGEVLTPKNGAELVEAVKRGPATERPILLDILAALRERSVLSEGALGNSNSPSASGPAATATPGVGTAGSVAAQAPTAASFASIETATAPATAPASGGSGHQNSGDARGPSSSAMTSSASPGGGSGVISASCPGGVTT